MWTGSGQAIAGTGTNSGQGSTAQSVRERWSGSLYTGMGALEDEMKGTVDEYKGCQSQHAMHTPNRGVSP